MFNKKADEVQIFKSRSNLFVLLIVLLNVDNYFMVCWFHPIFNVFRFHVNVGKYSFFDEYWTRKSVRVLKQIAHCQSRLLVKVSFSVARVFIFHVKYAVDNL